MVRGDNEPEAEDDVADRAAATIRGSTARDDVGDGPLSIVGGDFDGDGRGDLALGAPGWDGAALDGGVVAVFDGGALGVELELGDADALVQGNGALGRALSRAGDLDGDGADDLLAGATTAGNGVLYALRATFAGTRTLPGDELGSWVGAGAGDTFGAAVGTGSDLDGDGTTDIAAAATGNDDAGESAGKVYVFPGW